MKSASVRVMLVVFVLGSLAVPSWGQPDRAYVAGEVLVRVHAAPAAPAPETRGAAAWDAEPGDRLPAGLRSAAVRHGLRGVRAVGAPPAKPSPSMGRSASKPTAPAAGRTDLLLLRFDESSDVQAICADLARAGAVFAEPNYLGSLGALPDDPFYTANQKVLYDLVRLEPAWDVETGDGDTVIAVLDSGIDALHPDLAGRVLPGWNFVTGTSETRDTHGHGTRVAGIVGAAGDNGIGIAGVCWDCRLLPVVVADANGAITSATLVAALEYAAGQGAKVINLSLAFGARSQAVEAACNAAAQTAVLVASAGNNGQNLVPVYPAGYASVLSVGAVDALGYRPPFSNYNLPGVNEFVDLVAPGVGVFTTVPGAVYDGMRTNGTSFAAPFVSGTAALVRSKYPTQSPGAVRDHLERTAAGELLDAGTALGTALVPGLRVRDKVFDDSPTIDPDNDGDFALDGGETAIVTISLINEGGDYGSQVGTLVSDTPSITVVDNTALFAALPHGARASASFRVTVAPGTPQSKATLWLALPGVPDLVLSTAVEEEQLLSPLFIGSNRTLTRDKTWIIAGAATVDSDAVLTVDAGTTVKFQGGANLEVLGDLVSEGTPEGPTTWGMKLPPPTSLFRPARDFPVGEGPVSVAIGDVNGDTLPDIVTANQGSGDVSVIASDGAGGFEPQVQWEVVGSPAAVALGDLNLDGVSDVVTSSTASDTVTVLLSDETGGFWPAEWESVGSEPAGLAVGDANGDTVADIVTANSGSGTVSVLTNDGYGYFTRADYAAGSTPRGVALGDVTGDGNADLVVSDSSSNAVGVLAGDGMGDFAAPVQHTVGTTPRAVGLADVDGNGLLDIVVVNEGSEDVSVLRALGGGSFTPEGRHAVGSLPRGLALGDVTRDGFVDIVVANRTGGDLSLLAGNGQGGFASDVRLVVREGNVAVAQGDVTGDGLPDLVTANEGTNDISVLAGDDSSGFDAQVAYSVGKAPEDLLVTDVDGDLYPDLVTANRDSDDLTIRLGDGQGGFGPETRLAGGDGPVRVALADVTEDGTADLVAVNRNSKDVSLLVGLGGGDFAAESRLSLQGQPVGLAIGDINGDGRADIVVPLSMANDNALVEALKRTSSDSFQSDTYVLSGDPQDVFLCDTSGDALLDIFSAKSGSYGASILVSQVDTPTRTPTDTPTQTPSNTPTDTPTDTATFTDTPICNYSECFHEDPWQSGRYTASWGGGSEAIAWSRQLGGETGNVRRAVRTNAGSSAEVQQYDLTIGNAYRITARMQVTAADSAYWAEAAFRQGEHTAADFDANSESWTAVLKCESGTVGWATNAVEFTASEDLLTFGIKLGSTFPGADITAEWDYMQLDDLSVTALAAEPVANVDRSPLRPLGIAADSPTATSTMTPTPTATYTGTPSTLVNHLNNWSFEDDDSRTVGWTGGWQVNGTYAIWEDPPHGDNYGGTSAGFFYPSGSLARELYQTARVIPNETYQLSTVTFIGGQAGSYYDVTASLMWYDGEYPGLGNGQTLDSVTWDGPGAWVVDHPLSGSVVPTGNRLTYILRYYINGGGDGGGAAHFDACYLLGPPSCMEWEVCYEAGNGVDPPQGILAVDVSGDSRPELITANGLDNSISVLNGLGGTLYAGQARYSAGSGPAKVAAGDINGDLWPDLVVANSRSDDVSVLINDGAGGFLPQVRFAVDYRPMDVAVRDVNGDGLLDIVSVNQDSDNVNILLGNGLGSFSGPPPTIYAAPGSQVDIAWSTFGLQGSIELDGTGTVDQSTFRYAGGAGLSVNGPVQVTDSTAQACALGFSFGPLAPRPVGLVARANRGAGMLVRDVSGATAYNNAAEGILALGDVYDSEADLNAGVGIGATGLVQDAVSTRNSREGIRGGVVQNSLAGSNTLVGIVATARVTACTSINNGKGIQAPLVEDSIVIGSFGAALADAEDVEGSEITGNESINTDTIRFNDTTIANNGDELAPDEIVNLYVAGNAGGGVDGIPVVNSTIIGNRGPGIVNNIAVEDSNVAFNEGIGIIDGTATHTFVVGNWVADTSGVLVLSPATSPIETAPAFLLSVTPAELARVGVGPTTFQLRFSKDMDPSRRPIVTFGPSVPYTRHIVAPSPGWTGPRTWQGVYAMGYDVGSGTHTVRVTAARAADGFEIPPDSYHRFVVDLNDGELVISNGRVEAANHERILLAWDPAPTAVKFEVYRVLGAVQGNPEAVPSMADFGNPLDTVYMPDTFYDDQGLAANTLYFYQVRETDSAGHTSELTEPIPAVTVGRLVVLPGTGNGIDHFDTIGEAVAVCPPGGTILIYPSTYPEQVLVPRAMTLMGVGGPILNGNGLGATPGLLVSSTGVTIAYLRIQNYQTGIRVGPAGHATIHHCNFVNNTVYAVENLNTSLEVKAENCWWGKATGP